MMSWAGPVAAGVAGLAAAAGVGYLEGEKIGAAKAVAREILVRDHRELREIESGVELVRQKLYRLHAEERRALDALREAAGTNSVTITNDGGPAGMASPAGAQASPAGPANSSSVISVPPREANPAGGISHGVTESAEGDK